MCGKCPFFYPDRDPDTDTKACNPTLVANFRFLIHLIKHLLCGVRRRPARSGPVTRAATEASELGLATTTTGVAGTATMEARELGRMTMTVGALGVATTDAGELGKRPHT